MEDSIFVMIVFALIIYRFGYVVTGATSIIIAKWKQSFSVYENIGKFAVVGGSIATGLMVIVIIFNPGLWIPIILMELAILGTFFSLLTIILESKNKYIRLTANQFAIYNQFGLLDRWKFESLLRWINSDPASMKLLFDFEKRLHRQIAESLTEALYWYNRESKAQSNNLPEMLQVVIVFLEHSHDHKLHRLYKKVVFNIINTSFNFGVDPEDNSRITAEQFRLEASKKIANHSLQWGKWHPYQNDKANSSLGYLEDIANKIGYSQLFTAICQDIMPNFGAETTSSLIDGNKVNDLQRIAMIRQDIVPTLGLKATSSLLTTAKDFQEFEQCFLRTKATLEWWEFVPQDILREIQNISELDKLLSFLEMLTSEPKLAKFLSPANQQKYLRLSKNEVRQTCLKRRWKNPSMYHTVVDNMIRQIEKSIVCMYLRTVWKSIDNLQWQFDKFTEYVSYEMMSQDWTIDNTKTRRYWNWQEGKKLEYDQFQTVLQPQLCLIIKELSLVEIEMLFNLLPSYLDIQEFTKIVRIPVAWKKDVIFEEGYMRHVGFYEEKVEVFRPTSFINHAFVFEQPCLKNTMSFLSNIDNIRTSIQEYKNARY